MSIQHLHSTPARPAGPNTYTRYLELLSKMSQFLLNPPVRNQENTALLGDCGLTGTPLRVFLSGLEGKECSVCVHSVDGGEVGLHSPLSCSYLFV